MRTAWTPEGDSNGCGGAAWLDERRLAVTTARGLRILEEKDGVFRVKARGTGRAGGHVAATSDGRLVLACIGSREQGRLYGVEGDRIVELAKFASMRDPRALGNRLFATVKAVLHEVRRE